MVKKKLLKACTVRFKVNINSRHAPSLGLYYGADVAEVIFTNGILVPELL